MEVICETREDWWTALNAWLRSLGGSNGICDILFRLLDLTNSLIHLVHCNLSSNPDPECSRTFLANLLAWLKDQDVTNTDQLNSGTKVLLVIVAISVHVALSVLALTLHLPFSSNYFSNFGAKVVAMTRRTGSTTKRGRSSSISAKPQVSLPKDLNILKHFVTQVAGSGNLDLVEAMKVEDAKVTKPSKFFFFFSFLTQVTGYGGYKKTSFIEFPDFFKVFSSISSSSSSPSKPSSPNSSADSPSKQSSPNSSADEEQVKIVIKEDISKRPSSKKPSSKKNSTKKS